MSAYVCDLCRGKCEGLIPPLKCPNCGNDDSTKWQVRCAPLLLLSGHSQKLIVYEEQRDFGRDQFRLLGGALYRYVSAHHFSVRVKDDVWELESPSGLTNALILNGNDMGGKKAVLHAGDKIRIGPIELTVELNESDE